MYMYYTHRCIKDVYIYIYVGRGLFVQKYRGMYIYIYIYLIICGWTPLKGPRLPLPSRRRCDVSTPERLAWISVMPAMAEIVIEFQGWALGMGPFDSGGVCSMGLCFEYGI